MSPTPPVACTVAGTDSGGAAGVAADLTTFSALGVHGACVVTAVTAQDTLGVRAVHAVPPDVVAAQLDAVLEDLPVGCVKTGMLGTPGAVRLVAARAGALPLVVDPVLVATSGAVLGGADVVDAYRHQLLPVATVVTPNLDEARTLTGIDGPAPDLARRLADLGTTVVLTGGADGVDWLARPGCQPEPVRHARVRTTNDHGTGCTFSAALAALVASSAGRRVDGEVVRAAAEFTRARLVVGRDWRLGRGRGPVPHIALPARSTAPPHGKRNR